MFLVGILPLDPDPWESRTKTFFKCHIVIIILFQLNPTPNSINLNNSDTQQMNLDTRLVQLDAAINMELWQEAYKVLKGGGEVIKEL